MQIVEGSQNPTQWSHPSHPGSLWSLAILCGPLWCFLGPLWSLAVFIVTHLFPHFKLAKHFKPYSKPLFLDIALQLNVVPEG